MGIRVEIGLFVVSVTEALQRLFIGANPGGRGVEQADDRSALRATEAGLAPGNHVGSDASLTIGWPGQRDQAPFAGHEILDLDDIADGENVRVAGPHLLVDADPATLTDLEAGRLGQRGIRADPEGNDHDVGGVSLAGFRLHLECAVRCLLEAGHAVIECQPDAMPLDVVLDDARHLRIERRQELIEHFDEGHVEAAMHQIFGGLEADEAATDHHCPGLRPSSLKPAVFVHPGEEQGAALDPLADRPRIRHGPHLEDPRQVDPWQGWPHRFRPRRQHELVVGFARHFAGQRVAQLDGLGVRQDPDRFAIGPDIDIEHDAESIRGGHQQARFLFDDAADMVGQAAVRV